MSDLGIIEPNPDALAIARLYLEKYSELDEFDRVIYRRALEAFFSPLLLRKEHR